MERRIRLALSALFVLFALFAGVAAAVAVSPGDAASPVAPATGEITGVASLVWSDPGPGAHNAAGPLTLSVHDDRGVDHRFRLPAAGPLSEFDAGAVQGQRVRVVVDPERGEPAAPLAIVWLGSSDSRAAEVAGSQPWISLLCKFSDIAAEPRAPSFFSQMFANSPGRLDHYWREVSYDQVDIAGSTSTPSWLVLPHPSTDYTPVPGSGCLDGDPNNDSDLDALFADCTAVADPFVDFSNGGTGGYAGINLMFNGDLDGCAMGGSRFAALDGVSKSWRTTWEPPWGYANVTVMAHEMGHGFGLPHSNNWDNDSSPYDNSWDVMSDAWGNAVSDATYGTLGKHTIAYQKNRLGWFPADAVLVATAPATYETTVSDLALRPPVDGYRMVKIPIASTTRYWTVEVRRRTGLYDAKLPGDAVVIHEINPGRSQPAWCFDAGLPPGSFCKTEDAMWRVDETFQDVANQISVRVVARTADGFRVAVYAGVPAPQFADGFESGNSSRWSATTP